MKQKLHFFLIFIVWVVTAHLPVWCSPLSNAITAGFQQGKNAAIEKIDQNKNIPSATKKNIKTSIPGSVTAIQTKATEAIQPTIQRIIDTESEKFRLKTTEAVLQSKINTNKKIASLENIKKPTQQSSAKEPDSNQLINTKLPKEILDKIPQNIRDEINAYIDTMGNQMYESIKKQANEIIQTSFDQINTALQKEIKSMQKTFLETLNTGNKPSK